VDSAAAGVAVLGIETSCDETGVALVRSHRGAAPTLAAQALHSQVEMHADYGGVVPELASRDHIRRVLPLVRDVLDRAGTAIDAVDVVAYTRGPGLAGALLVGAGVACALAAALDRPALGIHHLEGHLLSPFLSADPPTFPFVALLVSGGHTQLLRVDDVGRYTLLGDTIDDAAGEAFDKSAKLLGLGYPGGPALARLADFGDPEAVALPRPLLQRDSLDFSFAGLKTAVVNHVRRSPATAVADVAASFQEAVVDQLTDKLFTVADEAGVGAVAIGGGVAANSRLRERVADEAAARDLRVLLPPLDLCTDNGAMIAAAGWWQLTDVGPTPLDAGIDPNLRL